MRRSEGGVASLSRSRTSGAAKALLRCMETFNAKAESIVVGYGKDEPIIEARFL
jgi:hypothetical protein